MRIFWQKLYHLRNFLKIKFDHYQQGVSDILNEINANEPNKTPKILFKFLCIIKQQFKIIHNYWRWIKIKLLK